MRVWGVLRQLLAATLCALLVAPAYAGASTLPRSSSTPSHTYDTETLSKTRVWGSSEKILLHFRATLLLSEKQHWGYEKCSWKNVVGSVVTYDYDAFGNLIHSTGTTPNNYLYSGEQFDPDLNLYFNRARYLNMSTGRFWTMDTEEGDDKAPLSLHKYLYASADPVGGIDPSGQEDLASLSIGSSIGNTLNNITAIQGQAIMDQVKYGGNAGLKSLFFTGVIIGGAIAIQGFGSIAREAPLLKAGFPGAVIVKGLSAEEAAFAEEIVEFRGGTFFGQAIRGTAGIDGFIGEVPASLKVLSTNSPQTVVDRVLEARDAAGTAGYFGAELFVSAKNIKAVDLLTRQDIRGADILGTIESIPREGIINAVNILTANGWLRFVR